MAAPTLPADVLDRAAARAALLCAVGIVFFGAALALLILQPAPDRQGLGVLPVAAAGLVASLAFWWDVRNPARPATQRLLLGRGYHLATAFVIAALELPRITGDAALINGLSSLCVWQLLFSGLVPMARRDVAISASVVTLAIPVTAGIAALLGRPIDGSAVLVSTLPVAVAGAVGLVMAQVVYGLSRQVQEARDVGSYRLVERLGEGGMGEVWRAEHRLLARPAAVKLIKPAMLATAEESEAEGRQDPRVLFEREAAVMATLRSPHTVELYDYGVREDGVFYYVMELLDGLDLGAYVEQYGPMAPPRVLHVLHGICLSLAEAHAAGLVHRDVKPANAYLCRLGTSPDVVKVLDFGLVQTADTPTSEGAEGDQVTGTALTVSPEVARGERATAASDLYAVGCVAAWLLTARLPFAVDSIAQLIFAHANVAPMPLAEIAGQPIEPDLCAVVDQCLRKDPSERPASAMELARMLRRCVGYGTWTDADADAFWDAHAPL